ncbi:MAG TPA: trehalase-like domain-containing protein, partial [Acidimicrobiales bacterium]|nr:trehalase-like domain-containing protein [Acidimicrobiales bacterium]
MPQPRPIGARRDGFAPIGDYAAIGDGRTVALVASDAAIDWLPLPTIDAPPSFAALLDPEKGGSIRIDPEGATRVVRRYVEDTNVLETTLHSESGSVRITDSLNVGDAGRLPWNELVRRIEGVEGTVDVRWEVAVGNRFDSAQPWACRRGEAALIRIADQMMAVTGRGLGESGVDGHRVTGSFEARAGSRHLLVVSSTDGEPVPAPPADEAEARLEATIEAWRRWCRKLPDGGRWAEAVRRSALALKLLIHAPTGAIAAAPTTSLPERIGAGRNYDYRFAWVRDMSFVV